MHQMGMRIARRGLLLALAVGSTMVACTGTDTSAGPNGSAGASTTTTASASADAASVCAAHFDDVRWSEEWTIASARSPGPPFVTPPPGPLDVYPDDAPVAMCLVPNRTGTFAMFAVVLSDGATFFRWAQRRGDGFDWPA